MYRERQKGEWMKIQINEKRIDRVKKRMDEETNEREQMKIQTKEYG